jgi:phosphoribosylanthranilate isomerase
MFRIKICGVTTVDDAVAAAEAGADAIGLNFCAQSPRHIDVCVARAIAQRLPPHVGKVGVFVDEPIASIVRIADELALDYVQLHGSEPPEAVAQLAMRRVIRAFRITDDDRPVVDYVESCGALGCALTAVLVDAMEPGKFGGTGRTANWDVAAGLRTWLKDLPLVLAGGLTAENVADAIRHAHPAAVDTASGVESAPGRKDRDRIARFVQAALRAWQD